MCVLCVSVFYACVCCVCACVLWVSDCVCVCVCVTTTYTAYTTALHGAMNPLHFATLHNHIDIVKYLVNAGVDVDAKDSCPSDPHTRGSESDHILCQYDKTVGGKSALALACLKGHLEIVKYLLSVGDVLERFIGCKCLVGHDLMYWAVLGGHIEVAQHVHEQYRSKHAFQGNLVHVACRSGNIDMINFVLARFPYSLEEQASGHWRPTPIFVAVHEGHLNVVRWLLETCEVDAYAPVGNDTVLHRAACSGQFECVKYLVENKCVDINSQSTRYYSTPLMCAAFSTKVPENDRMRIIEYLVQNGADLEIVDKDDKTALSIALEDGFVEAAWYLIRNCLTDTAPRHIVETAMFAAMDSGQDTIACYLAERFRVGQEFSAVLQEARCSFLSVRKALLLADSRPRTIPPIERSFFRHRLFEPRLLSYVFAFVGGGTAAMFKTS